MKYLTLVALLFGLSIPAYADDLTNRFDRQLSAVIKWEILWGRLPNGSLSPPFATPKVAIQLTRDSLSYCSHELAVCEAYLIGEYRNWEAMANALCNDKRSDEDALRAFVGLAPRGFARTDPRPAFGSGQAVFTGVPTGGSGMIWTTALHLGSRPEIVQQYRRMRPPELGALQRWIRTMGTGEHGLKVAIPCFASSDPYVFLSVTVPGGKPEVQTVFWNRLVEGWESADGFGPPMDRAARDQIRAILESIPCSTVVF